MCILEYINSLDLQEYLGVPDGTFCCILPTHEDNKPSAHIYITDDGTQIYKCFGCNQARTIISITEQLAHCRRSEAINFIKKVYKTNEVEVVTCNKINEDANPIDYDYDQYDIVETEPKYEIKKFKQFYGMSSKLAQEKHWCGMAKYRTSEGREKLIPYTGPVQNIIDDYLGGLRSYFTYCNIKKLKDAPKCTTFYRVNKQLNTVFANNQNI